ncbi:MAG: ATP synthase F1 subunit gamma [Clostridia bacterium]|nr:ATP synthase F1 subunit gamma [Clostridia bacterium]
MAGISTKAIKAKMKSMESTRQITKAMELVASSKLRGAQERAMTVRSYYTTLFEAMQQIASSTPSFGSNYLKKVYPGKPLYLVIAGDRGLAGGYNSNIFKLSKPYETDGAYVLPIGKRSMEHFKKTNMEIISDRFAEAQSLTVGICYTIAKLIATDFLAGKYSSVKVIYTKFESILSQTPTELDLLPLQFKEKAEKATMDIIYESGSESVFESIVPEYIGGVLYGCLTEALASEQAARRNAMNAASKNADEMISNLDLAYNRARQAAITQEITEIVAGSDA